jgi:hypothetical protein
LLFLRQDDDRLDLLDAVLIELLLSTCLFGPGPLLLAALLIHVLLRDH